MVGGGLAAAGEGDADLTGEGREALACEEGREARGQREGSELLATLPSLPPTPLIPAPSLPFPSHAPTLPFPPVTRLSSPLTLTPEYFSSAPLPSPAAAAPSSSSSAPPAAAADDTPGSRFCITSSPRPPGSDSGKNKTRRGCVKV